MGYRTGGFQYDYDPDDIIPMPRPWLEIDGDRTKNRKPLYPRGAARPKKPTFTSPEELFRRGGGKSKVDSSFLRKLPGRNDVKQKYPGQQGFYSKAAYLSTNKAARQATGDASAKKGVWIRYVVDVKYDIWKREYVPTYGYVRVPDSYFDVMSNPISYLENPSKILAVANFLWKYGANVTYKAFVGAVKNAVTARNEQLTDAKREYIEQEYARQKAVLDAFKEQNAYWKVS